MSGFDWVAAPARAPWLLLAPCVALLLWVRARQRVKGAAALLGARAERVAPGLAAACTRSRRVSHLILAGLLLAACALVEPRLGARHGGLSPRGGDLVIALDVSRSMLASDVAPTRLARAKSAIAELVERARGDRLALVLFAGSAELAVPLTHDVAALRDIASNADPDAIERGGSDLGAALARALDALGTVRDGAGAIVLLTDGEELGDHDREALARCRDRRFPVHVVVFGDERGSKIAITGPSGPEFLRDRQGREVVSRPDRAAMATLAAAGGGKCLEAAGSSAPLVELYESVLRPQLAFGADDAGESTREPRFQWPLAAACLVWLAARALESRDTDARAAEAAQ